MQLFDACANQQTIDELSKKEALHQSQHKKASNVDDSANQKTDLAIATEGRPQQAEGLIQGLDKDRYACGIFMHLWVKYMMRQRAQTAEYLSEKMNRAGTAGKNFKAQTEVAQGDILLHHRPGGALLQ